jgi:hypothetical protein
MTYQRHWQIQKKKAGCCPKCGKPVGLLGGTYCPTCRIKIRLRARKCGGYKARKPGCRGRPTKEQSFNPVTFTAFFGKKVKEGNYLKPII